MPPERAQREETPPRTWRRRLSVVAGLAGLQKHLHVRGEDTCVIGNLGSRVETPPRTWRRQVDCQHDVFSFRNTSTYVEKTRSNVRNRKKNWKHLHVRGEDLLRSRKRKLKTETPPRTWRRLILLLRSCSTFRNTSTYVEKTIEEGLYDPSEEKHLHVRGEDLACKGCVFT